MISSIFKAQKYIISFSIIGLLSATIIYFSTEVFKEFRHNFALNPKDFKVLSSKVKRTYCLIDGRKVYFDPYINPLQNTNKKMRSYQIQHFFTGKKQLKKDLLQYFKQNDLLKEYANSDLQYSRFDGFGRLSQRAFGTFILFCTLGIVLQGLTSRQNQENKEHTK